MARRTYVCSQCGRTFEDTTSRSVHRNNHYCGRECYGASRRKPLDEQFFSNVTPEVAYWAGFLMADGSVSDAGVVSLALQARDENHLLAFRDSVRSGHSVVESSPRSPQGKVLSARSIAFRSVTMAEDLSTKWGVVPRKTYVGSIPTDMIPDDLLPHYLRGLFDGDGGIYGWTIRLTSNHQVIDQVAEIFRTTLQVESKVEMVWKNDENGHETYSLSVNNQRDTKVVTIFLYGPSGPTLARKAMLANAIIQSDSSRWPAARRPSALISCEVCGHKFTAFQPRIENGGGRFCSRKCSAIARTYPDDAKTCLGCGKNFVRPKHHWHRSYCSSQCYYDRNIPDRDHLLDLLQAHPTRMVAQLLGISKSSVAYIAKKTGLSYEDGHWID